MAVGKELFKLWGVIGMQGVERVEKDLKKIDKQARRAQKEMDRFGRRVSDVGKVLTKALTVPLLAAAAASVKFIEDATDLNETISKTGELFGASAKEIETWADTSATKIGQSKQQAMDAASTFAIFGRSAGLAGKDLVKFSTEFVELASDMASFFNTEPEEAITAIGAAFRGETEPIRKYGVLLDDASMRQKALELGIVSTTKKALTPQNKVLAAQALIMEQTSIAQGDFARTSGGLANQKRILNAQFKNVSATLGQLFLPTALKVGKLLAQLLGHAERLIAAWKALDPATKKTIKGFLLLAAAIGPIVFAVGKLIAWGKVLIPILVALKTGTFGWAGAMAVLQKSVLGVTLVVGALVALGWYWYSQWETMSVQLEALWAKIRLFIAKGVNAVAQTFADGMITILKGLDKIAGFIPGLSEKVKAATIGMLQFKAALFKDLGKQQQHTNEINSQVKATKGLTEALKEAVDAGKEALGLKEKDTQATKTQVQAYNELADAHVKAWEKFKEREKLRTDFNEKIKDQINQLTLTELELLELERQEAKRIAEEKGADTLAVAELYALKEQELRDRIRKEEKAKDERELRERLTQATQIGNKLNSILSKFSDNRMKRLDLEEKRKIQAIENSAMTQEEKEAAIQKIQDETEKKRQKLQRQAAIREKAAALFNIAINTAAAVVKALPNIPLSIVVGALGVAEGVAVATTPLPFQEGGFIQGSPEGVNALVGENNQDEIVFPLERGIGLFIDGLVERLGEIELPAFAPPELAEVGAAGGGGTTILKVGTLIADEGGLKQLERRLDTIRIAENQRKGF